MKEKKTFSPGGARVGAGRKKIYDGDILSVRIPAQCRDKFYKWRARVIKNLKEKK